MAGTLDPTPVRIEPLGVTIGCRAGETVMQAARRHGLKWPTICNGAAICGQCHMRVLAGAEALAPPDPREIRALGNVMPPFGGPGTRLACQVRPNGPCTVERAEVIRA
jgi:ferredoxin, 2Fe-2S